MNIKIKVDGTDHFGLFCPRCDKIMEVKGVYTNPKVSGDKCTSIQARCKKCNMFGIRKIYWNDDGRFLE
jgi:phage FluMu protein Com